MAWTARIECQRSERCVAQRRRIVASSTALSASWTARIECWPSVRLCDLLLLGGKLVQLFPPHGPHGGSRPARLVRGSLRPVDCVSKAAILLQYTLVVFIRLSTTLIMPLQCRQDVFIHLSSTLISFILHTHHATHIRITSAIDVARAAQRGGGVSGRSAQQGTSRRICFSPGCPGTRYVDHCVGCRRRPHMGTGFLGLRILSLASTTRPSPCLSCRAGLPRRQCFDLRCPQEQHEQQGPARSCLASLGLIHRLTSIGSAPIEDEEDGSLGWLSADLAS